VAQVGGNAGRESVVITHRRKQILTAALICVAATSSPLLGPLQTANAGGTIITVSPAGDDSISRFSAAKRPLASIGRAIRLAQPGDTIQVRGGTYVGPAGFGARPGRKNAPIRLQNVRGERVLIKGTLQLENADYWQVSGINVTQNPADPRKEFLVKFDGGNGWRFTNSEVWGSRGVSNLMISGSARFGSPTNYRVAGNCIHDNNAVGDSFMNDHNIYLMPGYGSGPGVIEHNLLFNAENGSAIKAAGPTSATGAARVTIRRNTIARSAAGVIVGHGSHGVQIRDNLIGRQVKRPPAGARWVANYDAAVIGNHVTGAANVSVATGVWGFPFSLHQTRDSSRPIKAAHTAWLTPRFDSTSSCSGFHPGDSRAKRYGRFS
jgi:hypothetical protein